MNFKRIFYYYWISAKKYKWYFYFLIFTYSVGAILSNTLAPLIFKSIIDQISNATNPFLIKETLFKLVFIFGANIILYNIFYRIGDYLLTYFEAVGMREIAKDTFYRLTKHSYNFYTNTFAGSLVAKSRRFVSSFEGLVDRISMDFLFSIIKLVSIFIVLFYQIPNVAAAFFVWFVFYFFVIIIFLKKKIKYDVINAEADTKTTSAIADAITNIFNIKIFSSSKKEKSKLDDVIDHNYKTRIQSWNFSNLQLLIQGFMLAVLQILVVYLSVNLWLKGEISAGTVVLVQTYMMLLFDTLWNLSRSMGKFITHLTNAKEMVDIFDKPIDILDPENPEKLVSGNGEIEFKNVSFEYLEGSEVFKDFNLKIKAGEKVGLVGHSGSGKSTITKMLLRFVDVKEGEILIDGQNIKNITQDDLRSVISYVPQDTILFHRSILENIGYSKMDAKKEEVIEAAKKAHAHEFISNFGEGYNTLVGERGVKLSGGERQRVAIARAMLKDAPILVLDEATSSLDSVSEHYIQDSFNELMKGKTTIVIAHRLSTIQKMDRILVLDKGEIIEEGNHKELLDKGGAYANLWDHQTGGFLED